MPDLEFHNPDRQSPVDMLMSGEYPFVVAHRPEAVSVEAWSCQVAVDSYTASYRVHLSTDNIIVLVRNWYHPAIMKRRIIFLALGVLLGCLTNLLLAR